MKNYLSLMREVLDQGEPRMDRTGVGTLALFGRTLEFDLKDGFPAVTTKRLAMSQVTAELACFLRAYENLADFEALGCKIWHANATAPSWLSKARAPGDLGRTYGVQWRRWRKTNDMLGVTEVDQLREAVRLLRNESTSRRICVTAWNPGELDEMCLPPCHLYYQFYARNDGGLDCFVVMRSVDVFLGMPFDIASYALLMHIVSGQVGRVPRRLIMTFGDTHIYKNHIDQCRAQLERAPQALPQLLLKVGVTIDNYTPGDSTLVAYTPAPAIKAEMAL